MYKLSRTFSGHSGDVKDVKFTETGAILSVSRDGSAQIDGTPVYEAGVYLNSCAVSGPTVYCGAQDGTIAAIDTSSGESVFFMGHQGNVCALDASHNGALISGSWDKTARVWNATDPSIEPIILKGHSEAVWAVLSLGNDEYLTAGADKLIIHWKNSNPVQKFVGHTDAVRGLCQINSLTFASCSNDNTVRIWTIGANTSQVLKGHTSFVYSVAQADGILYSSGEDRTVRVWENGALKQTITLPCVSQWSVDASAKMLVVGSSDHQVRIFSSDPALYASEQELKQFADALSASSVGEDQVGRIDESKLKPESHITRPGKEGEIALIKSNGVVEAHQFSGSEWSKVGQVVGKSSDGEKKDYLGQKYDYVFDVDIKEGQPPLKLPFNNSDNPYSVAEKFVADNELPAVYVDQVVNFLIKNSEVTSIDGPAPVATASSYAPSTDNSPLPAVLNYSTPLQMVAYKIDPIADTFTARAKKHGDDIPIRSLITSLPSSSSELLNVSINAANKWGIDDMLCALDTLRLSIPQASTVPFVAVITLLLSCLDAEVPKHALLATRGLANLLSRHDARELLQKNAQPFEQANQMLAAFPSFTTPHQIAVATYALNSVIAGGNIGRYIVEIANKITEPEASYRLSLAIGVLAKSDPTPARQLSDWLSSLQETRSRELASAIASYI